MTAERKKIVLIGAGSAVFTRGLVADLILSGKAWDVALVDVDSEALETAYRLSERMIRERGAQVGVSAYEERREALPGAQYVVSTVGVGGRRAWEQDVFIPREFGVYQPVGDTIMPGGISRALRQVPVSVALARDILAVAPGARFFNYANPMAAICRAVWKATGLELVGLCHGVPDAERSLARLFGVPQERCSFTAVGMNHLSFFVDMRVDGEDAMPRLRSLLEHSEPEPGENLRRRLFLETGLYSVLHDRHLAEFFPQFHADGRHEAGRLGVELFSFEETIARGDADYAAMAAQARGSEPLDRGVFDHQVGEHEQLVDILASLGGSRPHRYSMIMPNTGQVENLPRDWAIESPAEAYENGVHPVSLGRVPLFLEAIVTKHLEVIELAVEAALSADRRAFLEAIIADGSAPSLEVAVALAERLWAANEQYLA